MMQLFEICGEDRDVRFSPFVWAVKMALKHKGLDAEDIPTHFQEKEPYAASGSKTVPVIKDGDTWVSDSFKIALYLEETYPQAPLFGGEMGRAQAAFFQSWTGRVVLRGLFPMLAANVCALLDASEAAYFRNSREATLGMTLEDARTKGRANLTAFQESLAPLEDVLKGQAFLSGSSPAWADYYLFGAFQWARIVCDTDVLTADSPIAAWRERMLDLFGGYARKAKMAVSAKAA